MDETCFSIFHKCSLRLASGEIRGQVDTLSSSAHVSLSVPEQVQWCGRAHCPARGATTLQKYSCHDEAYLVCHYAWVCGARQAASTLLPEPQG